MGLSDFSKQINFYRAVTNPRLPLAALNEIIEYNYTFFVRVVDIRNWDGGTQQ